MTILNRIKLEDCFDGSAVFTYEVSEPWTAQRARRLAVLGQFQYFADFPRPLFRLRTTSGLFVNGVEGGRDCRVVLPRANRDQVRRELEAALNGGDDHESPAAAGAPNWPPDLRPGFGREHKTNRTTIASQQSV